MGKRVRFLLCIDSIGKEEMLIKLAEHFKTRIVVNEIRYSNILCMNY